jgi:GDPmannose 4,6-dehydratase
MQEGKSQFGIGQPMKKALITGISGQDGSFLSELLLEKGYEVHGIVMRVELEDVEHRLTRIQHILNDVILHPAEMESFPSVLGVINEVCPDECYHLAAQSFVDYSFDSEFSTLNVNLNGTHNILAALKMTAQSCRFYFAGSSEMFGKVGSSPQDESTPFYPRSVYGISKVAGFHLSRNYRDNYGMFTCNGIMYNHESERRGFEFVTRKISSGVAKIKLGLLNSIRLGNLESRRDWGYAPEYVKAMWLMLQQDHPDDYVVGTGITHSVKELVEAAFQALDLDWEKYVIVDEKLFRPSDQVELRANPQKAQTNLGWKSTIGFSDLICKMVMTDYNQLLEKKYL